MKKQKAMITFQNVAYTGQQAHFRRTKCKNYRNLSTPQTAGYKIL